MKKLILLIAVFAVAAFCAAEDKAAAQPAPQPAAATAVQPAPQPAAATAKEEPGVFLCLGRGLCNICTGWLEIPRCMIYDNTAIPILGFIIGIPEGAFFTVGRELCGVFDILTFGTMGSTFHGEVFPDTVFQSKWIFKRK